MTYPPAVPVSHRATGRRVATTRPALGSTRRGAAQRRALSDVLRWALALALSALGVVALVWESVFRGLEAQVEALILRLFTDMPAIGVQKTATIWTGVAADPLRGFLVTPECSAFMPVAGTLMLTALFLVIVRGRTVRLSLAASLAIAALVASNLARLSTVIIAAHVWHEVGFDWTHHYVGTVISVLGVFAATGTFGFVFISRRRKRK